MLQIQNSYFFNILKKEFEHDIQKTLLVFCSALLVVSILQYVVKNILEISKLPPGPLGIWPFGILRFIGHEKHKSLMKLASTYGPLFSCKLGQQLYVVISDYKLIREIFKKESMTGRPKTPLYEVLNGAGVINAEGLLWKDQRRFLHEKLRRFGMTHFSNNNNKLQNMITSEISDLLSQLKNETKMPIDLEPYFAVSVSNVVCSLLMSVRFTRNDPKFIRFNTMIEEGMRLFGKIQFSDYIPMTKYLPTFQAAKSQIADNRKEMFEFYREVIDEHRRTFDRNNIRDLVDFYLLEIEIAKESGTEDQLFNGREHDEQIMQVMGDLFSAGMETIKTTLLWLIVFMLRNPNAKKQVQDELDSVIGRQRMPKYQDLQYLPHTESTIYEVLRISSIVPLATTHSPLIDEELNGFKIPAGSHVVPLINSVHMDPNLWESPNDFCPNRFINDEGKVQKPEYFIPFGVGRRMCLGDVLARMELFLFFSSIMHCFDIALPKGSEEPSLNGNPGVTIHPDNFLVCLKERPLDPITTDDQTPLRPFGSN